jgi:hypothetical protein
MSDESDSEFIRKMVNPRVDPITGETIKSPIPAGLVYVHQGAHGSLGTGLGTASKPSFPADILGTVRPKTPAEARLPDVPRGMPKDLTSYYLHQGDQVDGSVYSEDFITPVKGHSPSKREFSAKIGKITAARNRHFRAIELMNSNMSKGGDYFSKELLELLATLCEGSITAITVLMKAHEELAPQVFINKHRVEYEKYIGKVRQNRLGLLDLLKTQAEKESIFAAKGTSEARVRDFDPSTLPPEFAGMFAVMAANCRQIEADRVARVFSPFDAPRRLDKTKLPNLTIPKFSGKEEDWIRFKNRFLTAMEPHNLSKSELALRLIDQCTGEANDLIDHMTTTTIDESTFDTLMEIFDQRYGGQYIEDNAALKLLDKIPPILKLNSMELKKLFESMTSINIYYRRTNPDVLVDINSLVMRSVKQKFAPKHLSAFLEHCFSRGEDANFHSLLKFVSAKLEIARQCEKESLSSTRQATIRGGVYTVQEYDSDDSHPKDEGREDILMAVSQLRTELARVERSAGLTGNYGKAGSLVSSEKCPVCSKLHQLFKCPVFLAKSVRNRHATVKQTGYCFHCLNSKHRVKDCTFRKDVLCQMDGCVRYHHPLLHADSTLRMCQYEDRDSECSDFGPESFLYIAGRNTFSLQTIVCNLQVGRKQVPIIAMLDNGSQTTYIDENVAKDLALPLSKAFTRTIKVANERKSVECAHANLQLSDISCLSTFSVKALTLKGLAEDTNVVDWRKNKSKFAHLANIDFPSLPERAEISVIIGADNKHLHKAHQIVDGKSEHEPSAFKTPLGWTCLGASSPEQIHSLTFISGLLSKPVYDPVDIDTWICPMTDFDKPT